MRRWELTGREAIRVLVARYNGFGDQGKINELADLFAPDGVLEIHGGGRYVGPAGIEGYLSAVAAGNTAGGTYWRHFVGTHNVELIDRRAGSGTAYFQVIDAGGLNHWGRYRDRYQRDGSGRWHFSHRLVRTDGYVAGATPAAPDTAAPDTAGPRSAAPPS